MRRACFYVSEVRATCEEVEDERWEQEIVCVCVGGMHMMMNEIKKEETRKS